MPKTIVAVTAIIAFVLSGVAGCGGGALKSAEKVTIGVVPWPASASLYIADEKGYFRDEGLDITLYSYASGHLGLADVLAGKADLAAAGDTPIARAALDGKPLAVVVTLSEIDRAILIIARKDRGISVADDLKGKRIGVVSGTTADFFLHVYLATSYISLQDIQVVNLEADKLVDALLSGEVDAVSTWSPHTLVLRDQLGSNARVLDDPGLYTMTWDIVATQEFSKSNPERIKRFLRAVVRANSFITEHPDEARAISAKYIGADSPLYEQEWNDYRFTARLDESLILNLEDQARWMVKAEAGSAQRRPNFLDLIYTEGLKAAQPEGIGITGK
ncbi:MAG: ABC transporter substrate-binding protein [Chloroflexi bacterium]|nr:ABC transporter substrate-binding protein [Chloroflexota bacterium]